MTTEIKGSVYKELKPDCRAAPTSCSKTANNPSFCAWNYQSSCWQAPVHLFSSVSSSPLHFEKKRSRKLNLTLGHWRQKNKQAEVSPTLIVKTNPIGLMRKAYLSPLWLNCPIKGRSCPGTRRLQQEDHDKHSNTLSHSHPKRSKKIKK